MTLYKGWTEDSGNILHSYGRKDFYQDVTDSPNLDTQFTFVIKVDTEESDRTKPLFIEYGTRKNPSFIQAKTEKEMTQEPRRGYLHFLRNNTLEVELGNLADKRRGNANLRLRNFIRESRWERPCEDMFFWMSINKPDLLLDLTQSDLLKTTELTFALEAVGSIENNRLSLYVLEKFLNHPLSYVREGAVYGLGRHANTTIVRHFLRRRLHRESSPGVLEAIEEVLEGDVEFR